MAISGVSATTPTTKTTVDPVTGVEKVEEPAPASDTSADAQALLPAVDQAVQSTPLPADPEPTSGDPNSTISPKSPTPPTPPVPGAPVEPGPLPGYYVKASDYGVVGDGVTDNTEALNHAARDARAVGQSIYLGAGTYAHSGDIHLDSTQLNGDGDATVLKATSPDAGIVLSGDDPALTNVAVKTSDTN